MLFKFLFLPLFIALSLFAQIQEPQEPILPSIPTNTNIEKNGETKIPGFPLTGTVIFADKTTNTGTLYFAYDHITFYFTKNKKKYKNTQNITNIKSITFQKWKAFKQDKNAYIFFPVQTHIKLKNNFSFDCDYFIKDFEKFIFISVIGETKIYAYFYDYWEKQQWKNCKNSSKQFIETHPPDTCIKKIIFK